MALSYDTVTFLSDYGLDDEFVGIVHSVIRSLAPDVDRHRPHPPRSAAYDVRAGGLALARSAPYLCPGVVLAVVDPGVGTDRAGIAVEVGDGASVLVGPDNGLLAPAVAMCGGPTAIVELTNAELPARDRSAPPSPGATSSHRPPPTCATASPLTDLGTAIEPTSLHPGPVAGEPTRGRRADRRGAVGRPLRQRPAQRRCRRHRRRSAIACVCGSATDRTANGCRPLRRDRRRRGRPGRRLLRPDVGGRRSAVGRLRAGPVPGTEVRVEPFDDESGHPRRTGVAHDARIAGDR